MATAQAQDFEEEKATNIYRLSRSIKKNQNSLYNVLRSIYEDSIFVAEIAGLWPTLPLVANLRCGLWYSSRFETTCYFKSTDGHANNWSFSTSRLNLHIALLAGQRGGCIIVDSTRKGKRFPDSMSKTIPIWTCVLNRAIERRLRRMRGQIQGDGQSASCISFTEIIPNWDCSLHLPLWVSNTERAAIEDHIEDWIQQLEACGADIDSIAPIIRKPLRPLWISQKSVIWLNEVPEHDSWDFTPIILVSASATHESIEQRNSSEFSWHYIPGAGDDEESWSRGLHANVFWKSVYDLIDSGPSMCNHKVSELVENDKAHFTHRSMSGETLKSKWSLCWIGSTNLAVGTAFEGINFSVGSDCILNCCPKSFSSCSTSDAGYLHLPIMPSKQDRFSLMNSLHLAIEFAEMHLKRKKLLICCQDGEDVSVCVCLAILTTLFDEEGCFDDGTLYRSLNITKWDLKRRLVFVCKYAVNARPSRGNMKQVFAFLKKQREQKTYLITDDLILEENTGKKGENDEHFDSRSSEIQISL